MNNIKRQDFDFSGIYRITCINNHFYIGQAQNIWKRWSQHKSTFNRLTCQNPRLVNCVNKYGVQGFNLEVLEKCEINNLNSREEFYLNIYINDPECMNMRLEPFFKRGHVPSKESIEKQIKSRKEGGYKHSEETKIRIGNAHKGKLVTDATRIKLSNSHKGPHPWAKGKAREKSLKSITLISPLGEVITRKGIKLFSIEFNLGLSSVSHLVNGKIKSYKGWTNFTD